MAMGGFSVKFSEKPQHDQEFRIINQKDMTQNHQKERLPSWYLNACTDAHTVDTVHELQQ